MHYFSVRHQTLFRSRLWNSLKQSSYFPLALATSLLVILAFGLVFWLSTVAKAQVNSEFEWTRLRNTIQRQNTCLSAAQAEQEFSSFGICSRFPTAPIVVLHALLLRLVHSDQEH